jgi:hypothetical protein
MRRSQAPRAASDVPLTFDDEIVVTKGGRHPVLVVTPREVLTVGHTRMAKLRERSTPSALDQEILRQVRRRSGRIQMLMLRGQSDDRTGLWQIDPALSEAEAWELGYFLVRSQLPAHRRLLSAGVVAFLHVHFASRDVEAMRRGVDRLMAEMQAEPDLGDATSAIRKVDLWVLRHLSFYFSLSSAQVLHDVLPSKALLFESRIPRIRELLLTLPSSATD